MEEFFKELMDLFRRYPDQFSMVLALGYALGALLSFLFRFLTDLFDTQTPEK